MKKIYTIYKILLAIVVIFASITASGQTTLILFDFQDSDRQADGGLTVNQNEYIAKADTALPNYQFNATGSDLALSAVNWANGAGSKAWVFKLSTLGYQNLTVSSEQYGTTNAPRDFRVEYSYDSLNWTVVTGSNIVVEQNWTSGVLNNLTLPPALSNQDSVYLRWVMTSNISVGGGTVPGTGRSRIDDIFVRGNLIINAQSMISSVPGSEAPTISSLENDLIVSSSTDGVQVWELVLHDGDGNVNDADNLPTIYESITFTPDVNNAVNNWDAAIADAALFHGNTMISSGALITTNSITFSNLNFTVPDNLNDTISLRLSLGNPLPTGSDNDIFHFLIDHSQVSVAPTGSSQLAMFNLSSDPAANRIDVLATNLELISVPTDIFINEEFEATVAATDVNGNIDDDAFSAISLQREKGSGNLTSLSGLNTTLSNGTHTWTDLMYDTVETFRILALGGGLVPGISENIIALKRPYTILDDFNRADNNILGSPSSDPFGPGWTELETPPISDDNRIRIQDDQLAFTSCQPNNIGTTGAEIAVYDVSARYTTILDNAVGELQWYFNFQQGVAEPTGFINGEYGMAFIIGSDEQDFYSATANGYAVIFGETGVEDSVRLVSFTGGLTNYSTIVAAAPPADDNNFMSVGVNYDPCGSEWLLAVRDDGPTAFTDPQSVSDTAGFYADNTHTSLNLNYLGATWNHDNTCPDTATFDNFFIPTSSATAAIYSWDGSASTDFQDPENWTPTRDCAENDDILVINTGESFTISNVPDQTIGKLIIGNLTLVHMYAKTGGTMFEIAGNNGDDLTIDAGSSLELNGPEPLHIHLISGANATISGSVEFDNNTTSASVAHRLTAADSAAIIFETGSQFTADRLLGHAFGDTGQVNTVIFSPFAAYISEDGAHPFGLPAPLSKVVFETQSRYIHSQTAIEPDLAGRIYAYFDVDVPGDTLFITIGSAGDSVVMDHLVVRNFSTFITSFSQNNEPLDFIVNEDLNVMQNAIFSFSPDSSAAITTFAFAGDTIQYILGDGVIYFNENAIFKIDNPQNVALQNHVTNSGDMAFTNGLIMLNEYNYLLNGVFDPQGNSDSYIYINSSGRLVRNLYLPASAYTFPVGRSTYSPAYISCASCTGESVALGVRDTIYEDPQSQNNPILADVVGKMWDLQSQDTLSDVTVEYQWNGVDELPGFDRTLSFISYWVSGISNDWNPGPIGPATGNDPYLRQRIILEIIANAVHYFGIGNNFTPLPVELLSFNATALEEEVLLDWVTATEVNNDHYLLERSANGMDFHTIGKVEGAGTTIEEQKYGFVDKDPLPGNSYYRLKQVDFNGEYTYSEIRKVFIEEDNNNIILYPIPASDVLNIEVSISRKGDYTMEIVDISGKTIYVNNLSLPVGRERITLPLENYPAGTYFLRIYTENEVIKRSFVKK